MTKALGASSSRRQSTKDRVGLTQRQYDAALLAASGKTSFEIAVALGVSEPTAKAHLKVARQKLGVQHKRQLHDRLKQVHVVIKAVS